ncbi:ISAs1 family transposase, partial [Salmonella enterica subsp. enterica serovar Florida]|nr:ISAs1 family transposase [Salmonella enterica subsp. enterica serovar Newport]ECW2477348.1 ISAs1 family transposase [Salmonella enterica subsp. enterica serovar Florida]
MCFIDHFSALDDPRKKINIRYDFLDIVFLTVCAVVSGAEGWKDIKQFDDEKIEWLRQYRAYQHGIPVDDTIARLIRAIEPEKMNQAFIDWVNEVRQEQGHEQIAIDGKTLRHSYQDDYGSALRSITAWSKQQGLILAQTKSLGKKNENASVLVLLDTLNINGALISVDAMNKQKKIADKIISRGADYVLCVKNNHRELRNEIAACFTNVSRDTPEYLARYEETDAGHGRTEVRRYRQLRVNEWITESAHWQGLQTVTEVEREQHTSKTGEPSREKHYYISSLPPDG